MVGFTHNVGAIVGVTVLGLAAGYEVVALAAVLIFRAFAATKGDRSWKPPVTVLKPLCGMEPALYENLRSFCVQDYPQFQLVFGVRDAADPALAVVRRLELEFPHVEMTVVVSSRQHGSNRKISNLINMLECARYDVLSIVDSDARVGPDYLSDVIAPLSDRQVGLVTCIYRSVPSSVYGPGVYSQLGAMYVNEWYMPSVLLAWLFGHRGYASGQTLCLRRDTLEAIGGLHPIASHLADDYQLGDVVRQAGLKIVLSPYLPRIEQFDPSFRMLISHELRWMRTIRALRPGSFSFLFISFSLPLALLGLALIPAATATAWSLFGVTVTARLMLYLLPRLKGGGLSFSDLWLLPIRDLLLCWVWLRAFFTSRVSWRGGEFNVDGQGVMRTLS
jgi:ceramide glucosyltransferase